jgi:hypothetical protein
MFYVVTFLLPHLFCSSPICPSYSPCLCFFLMYSTCLFCMYCQNVNVLLALPCSLNSLLFIPYMQFNVFLVIHDLPFYNPLGLLATSPYLCFENFMVFAFFFSSFLPCLSFSLLLFFILNLKPIPHHIFICFNYNFLRCYRNLNLGLATKVRVCKVAGQDEPESHISCSRECKRV